MAATGAAAGVVVLLWLCLAVAPPQFVPGNKLEDRKAQNDVRTTLLQGLGGAVLGIGVYFTARQLKIAREGQITERYTRAVDQLGHTEVDVRIGGIYALERIARDSPHDQPTIGEVLTSFVRGRSPWPPNRPGQFIANAPIDAVTELQGRNADVQAAVTVLGRSKFSRAMSLDLHQVDLRKANLYGAHLEAANLYGAQLGGAILLRSSLEGANLIGARLDRAALVKAQLEGATLVNAHLEGANLADANLMGANLDNTSLERADLRRANLKGANLADANLMGANLDDANLERVNLDNAHLEGATLYGANLDGATLACANLEGADLRGANLDETNLRGANLEGTRQQGMNLGGAGWDDSTRWPEGLRPETPTGLPVPEPADEVAEG